ncbi:hypothetical protein ACTHGU_07020 [Chitinophagaceae bacterium MMS25-I14]
MGKLNGILPIEGTVGNITFAKTANGIIVKQKSSVNARRIAADPAFARTRENNREFGNAGKTGSFLFKALSSVRTKADGRAMSRLVKRLMQALQADAVSPRGQRTVATGNPALLEGFEFNSAAPLHSCFAVQYTVSADHATGIIEVDIPSFVPADVIAAPAGTTHYQLQAACVAADFAAFTSTAQVSISGILPLNHVGTAPISLTANLGAGIAAPMLVALGLSFFQEINGQAYALNNGAYNALAIVKVAV